MYLISYMYACMYQQQNSEVYYTLQDLQKQAHQMCLLIDGHGLHLALVLHVSPRDDNSINVLVDKLNYRHLATSSLLYLHPLQVKHVSSKL